MGEIMSYYDPYGMVQPGFVPGGPGDPSMGGAGYYGGMPGLLGPQGPAVNLGLLYRPWEPSYQQTYGPSGMYGFSWPELPNWSSSGGGGGGNDWLPDWDTVNPTQSDGTSTTTTTTDGDDSNGDQTDGTGGDPPGTDPGDRGYSRHIANQLAEQRLAENTIVPELGITVAQALAQGWQPAVESIGVLPSMDLSFNTQISSQPTVTRDLTGRTLPGYATPGFTTSAVTTAVPPDKEISVTDITNDFGGGGDDPDAGDTSGESFGGGDAFAW
tara:strand:- start:1924 stop:2733 length:810 start_codon:yes stop_codon:yes gene_type:complete